MRFFFLLFESLTELNKDIRPITSLNILNITTTLVVREGDAVHVLVCVCEVHVESFGDEGRQVGVVLAVLGGHHHARHAHTLGLGGWGWGGVSTGRKGGCHTGGEGGPRQTGGGRGVINLTRLQSRWMDGWMDG